MASLLEDVKVPIRTRLALLWTSVVFCYIYGDYFELYIPGKLQGMLEGQMVPLGPVTQGVLVGTAVMLAVPSLMIALSVTLPPMICRWLNVVVGLLYSGLMAMIAIGGGWAFYILLAAIEVVLTLLIVWNAWRWPRSHPDRPAVIES